MLKHTLALPLALLCATSHADNCEPIAAQIEARMRAGGLAAPRLITVEKGSASGGRIVGSCANGSRQIVHVAGTAMAGQRPVAQHDNILTECKDGRVVRGPDCSKPPPRPAPLPVGAGPASAPG